MNNSGSKLLGFDNIGKRNRVSLGHIAAHNPNAIAIDDVLRKSRGTATS
jgi:hypothetical protein